MKRPKKFSTYVCPHGKADGKTSRYGAEVERKQDFTVSGRYCKNNCDIYKARKCKLFHT